MHASQEYVHHYYIVYFVVNYSCYYIIYNRNIYFTFLERMDINLWNMYI